MVNIRKGFIEPQVKVIAISSIIAGQSTVSLVPNDDRQGGKAAAAAIVKVQHHIALSIARRQRMEQVVACK